MEPTETDSSVTVPEARLLKRALQDKLLQLFEDFTNQTGLLITFVSLDVDKEYREYLKVRIDARIMTDFIAEICSNHNGSLDRALALIDTAASIGCAGVKFQLFRIDRLYAPEVLTHPDYEFVRQRREWELPLEWLPLLAGRCEKRGVKFGCTPFYLEAVDELRPYVDFYKIASYNLLHDKLLIKVAKTGKPVVLSTGMATMDEIARAVGIFEGFGCNLTVLHCVSAYPMPVASANPMFIRRLSGYLDVKVGWSDHSVSPAVVYHLVSRFGPDLIKMVEFHLDLDRGGYEYGIGHCWLPESARVMIDLVRQLEQLEVLPDVQEFSLAEQTERLWRADPGDGLRPMREIRENYQGDRS